MLPLQHQFVGDGHSNALRRPDQTLSSSRFFPVMAGLVPAIHVLAIRGKEDVDARDKPRA
jgi:hypothetical protein